MCYVDAVKILQCDIFGNAHAAGGGDASIKKAQATPPPGKRPLDININSGISKAQATGDAMLIHRVLQKRLVWSGLKTPKQISTLVKLVRNEMLIKAGAVEPETATRDSLLSACV
ncbi:MAG: hypothetical protein LBR78_01535 [Holosporales bacterium]|jgi:hypothetical protein|nr:hypothetical protein [Holosporales bacterium]